MELSVLGRLKQDIHRTGRLVPGTSLLGVKIAIEMLKRYKSPGTNKIPS
jgi:hypothetical protein